MWVKKLIEPYFEGEHQFLNGSSINFAGVQGASSEIQKCNATVPLSKELKEV